LRKYSSSGLRTLHVVLDNVLLVLVLANLFLDLKEIDVGDGVLAVEDTGNLLEGGPLGLDVKEPDENKFDEVPKLVNWSAICTKLQKSCRNLQCKRA
jgi:hypothetical protein